MNLTITSLNENGYGVGQKGGVTLTVARTAVGDVVQVGPQHKPGRWSGADLLKVVKPGPGRVDAACAGFRAGCGGCQWWHLGYDAQIAAKEHALTEVLRKRGGYTGVIQPLVRMDKPEAYRNKLSLKNQNGALVFVPENEGKALAPRECPVETPALQAAWAVLRKLKVIPLVEQVHLRSNAAGRIGLHVFAKEGPALAGAVEALRAAVGAVGAGVTTRGGYRTVGDPHLEQTIAAATWLVPHNGFYQTNETMAAELLNAVRREAKLKPTDRVLDLYCGAGFFGLALAPQAHEVLGIEENPQSVAAAQAGAARSGVKNARFLAGDLGAVLATVPAAAGEVAVVDPPREGLLPRALEVLVARAPKRIVYVSCHASSLARDFKLLRAAGWKGVSCVPIDMFPHTSHLETILTLER